MKYLKYLSAIALFSIVFTSCTKDNPKEEEEHHHDDLPIVALTLKRTDLDTKNPVSYKFNKNDKSATRTISLKEGEEYNFEIMDIEIQHDDHTHHIIEKIKDDRDDYFFVYSPELTSKEGSAERAHLHINRIDNIGTTRKDGKKLGIFTQIEGHGEGSGKLIITLKHKPTKINDSGMGSAEGEDEFIATFPLEIVE